MAIAIILLGLALASAIVAIVLVLLQLEEARAELERRQEIIREQEEIIDRKEIFGAAAEELLRVAAAFEGNRLGALVPFDQYETDIRAAWHHRWKPDALDRDTETLKAATAELEALLEKAAAEAAGNTTGSTYEEVIDRLGGGFVTSVFADARTSCSGEALACVSSDDPFTVHFDRAENGKPWMTDWIRTGIAYHEYAHVLQFANPEPTDTALAAFDGDHETMADCFALTYLDGWTLDHRVWIGSTRYWDVSIGYGQSCTSAQEQALRSWYDALPFVLRPIQQ